MEMEQRLINLAEQVALERSKKNVSAWSDEIKREALFLVNIFGIGKVSKITKLAWPSLANWEKNFQTRKQKSLPDEEKSKFVVTRIIAQHTGVPQKESIPIASMIKDKIEFKIFCKEVALQIAERIFA